MGAAAAAWFGVHMQGWVRGLAGKRALGLICGLRDQTGREGQAKQGGTSWLTACCRAPRRTGALHWLPAESHNPALPPTHALLPTPQCRRNAAARAFLSAFRQSQMYEQFIQQRLAVAAAGGWDDTGA